MARLQRDATTHTARPAWTRADVERVVAHMYAADADELDRTWSETRRDLNRKYGGLGKSPQVMQDLDEALILVRRAMHTLEVRKARLARVLTQLMSEGGIHEHR